MVDTKDRRPARPERAGVALPTTQDICGPRRRRGAALAGIAAGLAPFLIFSGCAALDRRSRPAVTDETVDTENVTEIYARAGIDRAAQLELERAAQFELDHAAELEVERLRADLREAEESMVAIESGLRGVYSRADAVSTLAESRIAVERASQNVPWRGERVLEAQQKIEEAERQFQAGHTGSAVFFASRARRVAAGLNAEAERVASIPGTRFIDGQRVNLRAGSSTEDRVLHVLVGGTPVFPDREDGEWVFVLTPSGQVGWVHASLLRDEQFSSSHTTTQSFPASLAR
jgi:hypothetical protein